MARLYAGPSLLVAMLSLPACLAVQSHNTMLTVLDMPASGVEGNATEAGARRPPVLPLREMQIVSCTDLLVVPLMRRSMPTRLLGARGMHRWLLQLPSGLHVL